MLRGEPCVDRVAGMPSSRQRRSMTRTYCHDPVWTVAWLRTASVMTALRRIGSHLETTTDGAGRRVNLPHSAVCVMAIEGSATFAWNSGSYGRCVYTGGLVRPGNNPAPHVAAGIMGPTRLTPLRTCWPQRSTCIKAGSRPRYGEYRIDFTLRHSCHGTCRSVTSGWSGTCTGLPWSGCTSILGRRFTAASLRA